MAMQIHDKLIAAPRGSAAEATKYYIDNFYVERVEDVRAYVNEVYRVAPLVGIDPSIAIAQADLETDRFRSYWWKARLNPAGLGITGDPQQNAASRTFANGIESARAQVAHLLLYATGTIRAPLSSADDPRYDAYLAAYGNKAMATTIEGLAGNWAKDSDYHYNIVKRGNECFPNLPDSRQVTESGVEPAVIYWGGKPWTGLTNIRIADILFRAQKRTVHVNVDTLNVRQYAETASPILRTYHRGDAVSVLGYVVSEKVGNENRWWITADYGRMWVGGTSEKPR